MTDTVLGRLKLLLQIAALGMGIWVLDEIHATVHLVGAQAVKITQEADDLKQMVNATLFQVGDASHELADTAREQRQYWNQAAQDSVQTVEQLNATLLKTQQTMDTMDGVMKSIGSSQAVLTDETVKTLAELQATLEQSRLTMAKAEEAMTSANKVVADPNIAKTLEQMRITAENAQKTSASIDAAIARWTKPKSLWKSLTFGLLDFGAKTAQIIK